MPLPGAGDVSGHMASRAAKEAMCLDILAAYESLFA